MAEPHFEKHVFICTNRRDPGNPKGCCAEKGSEAVRDEFKRQLHERGVKGRMRANAAGCLDQCARGVTVVVYPEQVWYGGVKVDDVREIVDEPSLRRRSGRTPAHEVTAQATIRAALAAQPHRSPRRCPRTWTVLDVVQWTTARFAERGLGDAAPRRRAAGRARAVAAARAALRAVRARALARGAGRAARR